VGALTLLVGFSIAIIQYKVPTIMGNIMAMFSMSAAEASWLMSIFTLVGIFIAIPSGGLAEKFGPKRMLVVSSGIIILGSVLGAFSTTSTLLVVSRAIEGIALTIITTSGPILIERCVKPEKIGTALGIWGVWGCLGAMTAAVITPTAFEMLGFQGVWFGYAAVSLVAAILLLAFIHSPAAGPAAAKPSGTVLAADAVADVATTAQATKSKVHYRELLTANILLYFIGFIVFQICLLAILAYVPIILQMQGFDPTLSGFISTSPMLLSLISSPLFGIISDRIGRRKPLMLLTLAVMGPSTFIMYNNTGPLLWVAVILIGLIGLGYIGLSIAAMIELLPGPKYVPLGMGMMVLMQGVGQFLGTYVVQALLGPDLTNWFFAGVVIMALGMLSTVAMAFVRLR
jgi:MFS family permease